MSHDRSQGAGCGVVLVVILGIFVFLGFGCVAAGFLFFSVRSAPMPIAPTTVTTQANTGAMFDLRVAGAKRLEDGSYNIFLVGKAGRQGGTLDKLDLKDVRLEDLPAGADGACSVQLPLGPPYPPTVDFVVRTRPLPDSMDSATLHYDFQVEGSSGFSGTFGMSSSGSLRVELKPAAKASDPSPEKAPAPKAEIEKIEAEKADKAPAEKAATP